jgi:protein-L-isoaspartate(D-aspartate) O-methyltransferase
MNAAGGNYHDAADEARWSELRSRMVQIQLSDRGITDRRVLDAMARVPRHEFTPQRYQSQAYEDYPLPIGEEQTISQPYIVALMLEALRLTAVDRVLEVGTGSGYVTALLAEMVQQVFSIERHACLADNAGKVLVRLGYANVRVIVGDGSQGFAAGTPYNAILVSAAALELPSALLEQLGEGGRMIIPLGPPESQQLQLIEMENGQPKITRKELCRFVPLVVDAF